MSDSSLTADFVTPGRGAGLLDVVRQRYLLRLLVRKELRVRYHGSVLGLAWSYVKPAVQFVVFYFAMGEFLQLKSTLQPFAVYLFSGIVVVNLFTEAFGNATRSVVGNAPLVNKIYLPRELFPVSSLLTALVHFVPQVVVLAIGSVAAGWRPDAVAIACAVLGFLVVSTLALGLGLLFGSLNVLYRDLENVVDLILMVVVWFSPVLYPLSRVRDALGAESWAYEAYLLNPVTSAVSLFHRAFWFTEAPPAVAIAEMPDHLVWRGVLALFLSLLVLVLGQVVFRRCESRFAQEL